MAKKDLSRPVIDALKSIYMDGSGFADFGEVRRYVTTTLRVRASNAKIGKWDREARYELAAERVGITSPGLINKGLRKSNATSQERITGENQQFRDLATRIETRRLIAAAHASQPDASRREIEREIRLNVALDLVKELV